MRVYPLRGVKVLALLLLVSLLGGYPTSIAEAGTLSCSVSTSCASGVVLLRMSDTSNAHAEQGTGSIYSQLLCCSGVGGLANTCTDTNVTVLKLSGVANAHVEQNSQNNYPETACMSVPSGGSVTVGYQSSNCTGYDTTLASMSASTNAQIGDGNAYTTKICGSADGSQSLSFSISDNSIGFGALSTTAARYATGDTSGSGAEVEAHTLTVNTNANGGYSVTIQGSTLTSTSYPGNNVAAIGANTSSSIGTEQFGLRLTVNSGSGTVSSPYAAAGFAYEASLTASDQIVSGPGDGVNSVFSVRYLANIDALTEDGTYSTTLNFVATGSF